MREYQNTSHTTEHYIIEIYIIMTTTASKTWLDNWPVNNPLKNPTK